MLIGINQWCTTIGLFWKGFKSYLKNEFPICLFLITLLLITFFDIENNPGPKSKSSK